MRMKLASSIKQHGLLASALVVLGSGFAVCALPGCGGDSGNAGGTGGIPGGTTNIAQVQLGRSIVLQSGCADCHSGDPGRNDPSSPTWLSGFQTGSNQGSFQLGPATTVHAANLTPDATGLGGVSERRIFNALKFGLDPMDPTSPDSVLTTAPPAGSHYLAPVMPWQSFRNHTDAELWAIVAYLKHGIKPVAQTVDPNVGDGASVGYWANTVAPMPGAFPQANEGFNP